MDPAWLKSHFAGAGIFPAVSTPVEKENDKPQISVQLFK
jgi:hypothetical protein